MSARGTLLPFRRPESDPGTPVPMADARSGGGLSDEALLAACVVGDAGALAGLYDRHQGCIFRFVSRVSCGPSGDVEDLVQCTFIEVWKSAARFHKKGSVRSWIFGISANLTRHYVRSEVRRRTALDGFAQRPESPVTQPDDALSHAEMLHKLQYAVEALSYDLRVAFVLCDIEDMAGVDAAQALGVRKGTLWRRLHDARKSLRSSLEQEQ